MDETSYTKYPLFGFPASRFRRVFFSEPGSIRAIRFHLDRQVTGSNGCANRNRSGQSAPLEAIPRRQSFRLR